MLQLYNYFYKLNILHKQMRFILQENLHRLSRDTIVVVWLQIGQI